MNSMLSCQLCVAHSVGPPFPTFRTFASTVAATDWRTGSRVQYGLQLGPESSHSLETASFSTNKFEFRPPAVRAQQAGYSNDCRGMSCSRPVGWVHASASMALQPWISHSGCCTSSTWGPEPHQNPRKARSATLQVSPPPQPASCIHVLPSHCQNRSTLTELLTLCAAGDRYVAIWPPWSDPGTALEPDQSAAAAR